MIASPTGWLGQVPQGQAPQGQAPQPEHSSGVYVGAYLSDPGTYLGAAAGAGVAYLGGRSITNAVGGALVGSSFVLMSHSVTARQMSKPFMIGASVLGLGGVWLASRRSRPRRNRRRRTSRRRR